jgi:predicted nucleic acid-binding protein
MSRPVLVDTCTIVNFAAIGRLDLLEQALGGCGHWTEAAALEVHCAADHHPALWSVAVTGWLGQPVEPGGAGDAAGIFQLQRQLGGTRREPRRHLAEAEAIHLILRYPDYAGAVLLTDDRPAGDLAAKRGIDVWLSIDLITRAFSDGHIGCPTAYELLLDMEQAGRGVYVPPGHQSVCP